MRDNLPNLGLSWALALALALSGRVTAAGSAPPAAGAAGVAATASPLPWIANDWPRAVSLARARKVPIFVENWAPW